MLSGIWDNRSRAAVLELGPFLLGLTMSTRLVVTLMSLAGATLAAQPNLEIIVIAGENAVNIVQQRTAVAPIVEVRDRNGLPVAGALVTFTIGGGRNAAFGGGLQSLTVTTDAVGRAAASALTPTGTGMLQIEVVATHRGETAATTIAQTNYATPSDAVRAGRATAGAAGGALVAGGSTGGGLSPLVIGLLAGGVGGAAIVAVRTLGDNGETPTPSATGRTYTGGVAGTMIVNFNIIDPGVVTRNCVTTRTINATMQLLLSQQSKPRLLLGNARVYAVEPARTAHLHRGNHRHNRQHRFDRAERSKRHDKQRRPRHDRDFHREAHLCRIAQRCGNSRDRLAQRNIHLYSCRRELRWRQWSDDYRRHASLALAARFRTG